MWSLEIGFRFYKKIRLRLFPRSWYVDLYLWLSGCLRVGALLNDKQHWIPFVLHMFNIDLMTLKNLSILLHMLLVVLWGLQIKLLWTDTSVIYLPKSFENGFRVVKFSNFNKKRENASTTKNESGIVFLFQARPRERSWSPMTSPYFPLPPRENLSTLHSLPHTWPPPLPYRWVSYAA